MGDLFLYLHTDDCGCHHPFLEKPLVGIGGSGSPEGRPTVCSICYFQQLEIWCEDLETFCRARGRDVPGWVELCLSPKV